MFDYRKILQLASAYTTLNAIQSISHIPRIHKANLTWWIDDTMMQQNFQGWLRGPGIYQDCIIDMLCKTYSIFLHSTWAGITWIYTLAEKLSADSATKKS